tara:strand:+ start:3230 stop:3442 length:213 start_codon:yes stop_codon:yes gene_type:complete
MASQLVQANVIENVIHKTPADLFDECENEDADCEPPQKPIDATRFADTDSPENRLFVARLIDKYIQFAAL